MTDLLVICDGSCGRWRHDLGWSAQLYWPHDTSTRIKEQEGQFIPPFARDWVTPGMGELACLYLALQLTKDYLHELDWTVPLRIQCYNDCLTQVENAVLHDPGSLANMGAEYLAALGQAVHALKMDLTRAGHDVVIQRPHRGRRSRLIRYADERARWARLHGAAIAPDDVLLAALTDGSIQLRQLRGEDLRKALR